MAKYIEFDKKHFDRDGLIPLTRGDDWELDAKIIDQMGNYKTAMNLQDMSVTAFFKADKCVSPGLNAVTGTTIVDSCNGLKIKMSASGSVLTEAAMQGIDMYITLEDTDGNTQTVYTVDQPLGVRDRDFTTF